MGYACVKCVKTEAGKELLLKEIEKIFLSTLANFHFQKDKNLLSILTFGLKISFKEFEKNGEKGICVGVRRGYNTEDMYVACFGEKEKLYKTIRDFFEEGVKRVELKFNDLARLARKVKIINHGPAPQDP